MFSPRFVVTNKILVGLIELEKAVLIADMAPLQPDWEVRMKQECLSRRAYAVLRFSDSQLDAGDVAKIIKDDPGRDDKPTQVALRAGVVAKEKDVQKVMNWLNANKLVGQTIYLSSKFKQERFGEKDLLLLNNLLEERILNPTESGKYRESASKEYSEIKAPLPVEVKYQMEDLFSWYAGVSKSEIHPVIKAGVMLLELMRIRSFEKDNLSCSLFFTGLIMASEGYSLRELWAFEEEILKNRPRFFELLGSSVESGDLTGWLEFLVKSFSEAGEKTRTKIMNLVGDRPIFKSDGGKVISLSERQISIMEEMTVQAEMTIKEIRSVLPMVSDDTILRDLKDLIEKKLLKKKGKTKGAVYVLGKVRGFK